MRRLREKDIDAANSILRAVDLGEDNIRDNLKFEGLNPNIQK